MFGKNQQNNELDRKVWVPDSKVNECMKCRKNFTFFYRKHHCRMCGWVFCNACTTVKTIQGQKEMRICNRCEKDLDTYNKTLLSKNLILHNRIERQNSFTNASDFAQQNGTASGAPKNVNQKVYVAGDDSGDEYDYKVPRYDEDEETKEQKKKIAQILDEAENAEDGREERKIFDFDQKDPSERTFSGLHYQFQGGKKELTSKQALIEYSMHHIRQIVTDLMVQHKIDQDKWGSKLFEFVRKAVEQVKPSSRRHDPMDFNHFIKIKIINYEDNSKSEYINGIVLSKNIADKRMKTNITNPKILLVKDSISTDQSEGTSLQTLIEQENNWINIIKEKLTQVKPNIIIVEKDVGYKILDVLRQEGITVISNLDSKKMKRINRYTDTIIAPSYNIIEKSFKFGTCSQFRVEEPFTGSQMMFGYQDYNQNINTHHFISNDRSLLYFIGTNPELGCTILLSGNLAYEKQELATIKTVLREMLKLARNVVLERSFLNQINCKVPYPFTDKGLINSVESPFLITKNIKNRSTLVLNKVIMKKGIAQAQGLGQVNQNPVGSNMIITTSANVNQTGFIQHNNQNADASMQVDTLGVTMTKGTTNEQFNQKVDENYVKRKIDSMCGCPQKEKNTFYIKDKAENECTFGRFLFNLAKLYTQNFCEGCKEPMTRHFIQYYHKQGCLEIQYEQKQNLSQGRNLKDYDIKKDILIRGECQICKKQVTEETILSSSFYEYSKARFLEQFFYNGDNLVNNNVTCNHKTLKDIQWIFMMPAGNQISFNYIPQEVFSIKMIQPKREDTRELYALEISKKQDNMRLFTEAAYFDIKKRMNILIEFIHSERAQYVPADFEKVSPESHLMIILNPLEQIISSLSPQDGNKTSINQGNTFEQDITFMKNDLTKAISEIKTIFEATFLERKIVINFLTYSKILEETAKVTCLQLSLLKMRHMKQLKNESSGQNLTSEYQDPSKLALDSDLNAPELSKFGSIGAQNTSLQGVQLARKNSHTVDLINDQSQLHQQQNQNSQQAQKAFIDEFILNSDTTLNQTPNMSATQANIALTGKFTQPQNPLDGAKKQVQQMHDSMLKQLKDKWDQHHEYQHVPQSKNLIEEEEKNPIETSVSKDVLKNYHREGSFTQTLNPKSNIGMAQMNQNDMLQSVVEAQQNWMKFINCGYVTMPLGSDNFYIPLDDSNLGSILSYALSSNIYKEAMIKQNYMDIFSKIKPAAKNIRANLNATMAQDPNTPQVNIRDSISGNPAAALNVTSSTPLMTTQSLSNPYIDEYTKLYGKDDVFNFDLSPHQIETELLSGEKLSFLIKFSTEKKDLTLKIEKNNQHTKLVGTSMQFQSGQYEHIDIKDPKKLNQTNSSDSSKQLVKKELLKKNDLQEKIAPNISKDYMDISNPFLAQMITVLDTSIKILNCGYFQGLQIANKNDSPVRNPQPSEEFTNEQFTLDVVQREINNTFQTQTIDTANINQHGTINTNNIRDSMTMVYPLGIKSPQIGGTMNLPSTPQLIPPPSPMLGEFCTVKSPILMDPLQNLKDELYIPKVEYEIKVFFAKKFEALRRFYCGTQFDFIQSLIKSQEWTTVTGGKTKSKFYRSFDDKYVFKEIKKNEFNWFIDFAPQYFDYMCKSFFHNYPCALCKILGAFKIKILKYKNSAKDGQPKITKKYIYITENLNFGIKPEDEAHIVRYDLKGSTLNRFVKDQYLGQSSTIARRVLHDNNFQLEYMGRPLPIRYTINRILHICINNDTMFLSKCNIVDYSLLTIIDKKRKKVRFGIIDYMQMYNLDKIFEGKFKRIINRGEVPTIVDPDKYKFRFKRAMKRYFIGMVVQEEKREESGAAGLNDLYEAIDERQDEEDELNETINHKNNKTLLNESQAHITFSQKALPEVVESTHNILAPLQQQL